MRKLIFLPFLLSGCVINLGDGGTALVVETHKTTSINGDANTATTSGSDPVVDAALDTLF